jgi:hypothetical protein
MSLGNNQQGTTEGYYMNDMGVLNPSPLNSDWLNQQQMGGNTGVSLKAFYSQEEILYYEYLFKHLSENGSTCEANKTAPFLKKSGVKVGDLKEIWRGVATASDKLHKEEFYHFCKYLSCIQNGVSAPSQEYLNKPMPLVKFDGYDSDVIVAGQKKLFCPAPAPEKVQQTPPQKSAPINLDNKENSPVRKPDLYDIPKTNMNFTPTGANHQANSLERTPERAPRDLEPLSPVSRPEFAISAQQLGAYQKFAERLAEPQSNMIKMTATKGYIGNSGVPQDSLKKIVSLINPQRVEDITKAEFILMLHLIYCIKKESLQIPDVLPLELQAYSRQYSSSTSTLQKAPPLTPVSQ